MIRKIYATYRPWRLDPSLTLSNITLNWNYTPSFFMKTQFLDWYEAGWSNIIDWLIVDSRYTWELESWIPFLRRLMVWEYDDTKTTETEFGNNLAYIGSFFAIEVFENLEEARQWIRDNTNLIETSTWTFELTHEYNVWQTTFPATYLVID